MKHYHERTNHTYDSVRIPRFLDWDTQPSTFKTYPSFYNRIPFTSLPLAGFWPLCGGITEVRQKGDHRYSLRVNPSAGALFPTELYIQIRDQEGLMDGIYHYEAPTESLTLLHPVDRDGVEPYLGLKRVSGFIFLVSSPWFRSVWKYGERGFRYCNLDVGHQLGALEAACMVQELPFRIIPGFQKGDLSIRFGFEDKEFFLAAAMSGEEGEDEIRGLKLQFPFVLPTDYHEENSMIVEAFHQTLPDITENDTVLQIRETSYPYKELEGLPEAILRRRSVRAFHKMEMESSIVSEIMESMGTPVSGFEDTGIQVYSVVSYRVPGMEPGIYKNGQLIQSGDFMEKAGYLCLEQKLGSDSGVTLFFTGKSEDYQSLMQLAGLLGHRVYLESTRHNCGVSGIGAYYDHEVQEFLGTDEWILYSVAIGI